MKFNIRKSVKERLNSKYKNYKFDTDYYYAIRSFNIRHKDIIYNNQYVISWITDYMIKNFGYKNGRK